MIYQRHIPNDELFSAQLELLMQNARVATVNSHLAGVLATAALFWVYLPLAHMLLWGAAFLILLLLRSLHMSNSLVSGSYVTRPERVYWQLLLGSAATGGIWAAVYITASFVAPPMLQYAFLLLIIMVSVITVGVTVVIREYFIVYLFSSLWPIAWWSLVHYEEQPFNMLVGLMLLVICAVLVSVTERMYQTFLNMISLNWERETMSRELGQMARSLRDSNSQLRDVRSQLTDLANVDELTGLGNRRLVNRVLQDEINRARRTGAHLSIILLDVDYFKNYNDTYGHLAGDAVLQRLADVLRRATARAGEVAARYGGEEFILILPGADGATAKRTAKRLQQMVKLEAIPHSSSKVESYVTVSQGCVSVLPEKDIEPGVLLERADKLLYQAKGAGRNTFILENDGNTVEQRFRAYQHPPTLKNP